jgi:hypothetical protein
MKFLLFLLLPVALFAHPFTYDLHLTRLPGTNGKQMICCHGMGGNWEIARITQESSHLQHTFIGFNFPDHDIEKENAKMENITFGTIDELLPLLYVLKMLILDENEKSVELYGYSAGGGAIVNTLAVLNSTTHDLKLEEIGIGEKEKERLLAVIQQGKIILDTPLKSLSEILSFRGEEPELLLMQKRYQENGMEPIEAIGKLKSLSLNVLIHFEVPDLVLSNRDDSQYIERFKKTLHSGSVTVSQGNCGHSLPHPALWKNKRFF